MLASHPQQAQKRTHAGELSASHAAVFEIMRARPWSRVVHSSSQDRHVLVIGGGPIAAWWVRAAVDQEQTIVVVASQICDDLLDLLVEHRISWVRRNPIPADLTRAWIVHVSAEDVHVSAHVRDWVKILG